MKIPVFAVALLLLGGTPNPFHNAGIHIADLTGQNGGFYTTCGHLGRIFISLDPAANNPPCLTLFTPTEGANPIRLRGDSQAFLTQVAMSVQMRPSTQFIGVGSSMPAFNRIGKIGEVIARGAQPGAEFGIWTSPGMSLNRPQIAWSIGGDPGKRSGIAAISNVSSGIEQAPISDFSTAAFSESLLPSVPELRASRSDPVRHIYLSDRAFVIEFISGDILMSFVGSSTMLNDTAFKAKKDGFGIIKASQRNSYQAFALRPNTTLNFKAGLPRWLASWSPAHPGMPERDPVLWLYTQ